MIRIQLLFLSLLLITPSAWSISSIEQEVAEFSIEEADREPAASKKSKRKRSRKKSRKRRRKKSGRNSLSKVKKLALAGNYEEAAKLLFTISRGSRYKKEAAQVKYMLGLMLMELKLYQTASFVFYDVIDEELKGRSSRRYLKQSLGKLSKLSNLLDSDVLLKYAVSRIKIKDFPADSRDLFFYRFGELKLREGRNSEAARAFARVDEQSAVYPQALYRQGLAYTEQRQLGKAIAAFEELLNFYSRKDVTHPNRANALLALARVYYQGKKWTKAISYYRLVPRDTLQWHDAIFEMSWAMFRSGRFFRSALSNFHTLHSPYYENYYNPESLLLRSIIYLYICRYDEMEKVLDLFDRLYKPAEKSIRKMLSRSNSDRLYWDELRRGRENKSLEKGKKLSLRLDPLVIQALLSESDIRSNMNYYDMLLAEEKRIKSLGPDWTTASIGKFSNRIIRRRKKSSETLIGKLARNHLIKIKSDLRDFFEQSDFLKFEMVSGKKEAIGKQLVGKGIPRKSIIDDNSRSYFIANGYEYWPFKGEYWLDELGNYHYVGVQACK